MQVFFQLIGFHGAFSRFPTHCPFRATLGCPFLTRLHHGLSSSLAGVKALIHRNFTLREKATVSFSLQNTRLSKKFSTCSHERENTSFQQQTSLLHQTQVVRNKNSKKWRVLDEIKNKRDRK